jgi:hypothetical protein
MFDPLLTLLIAATALNGLLAGASLDQSIKQLPARRRIGVLSYSPTAGQRISAMELPGMLAPA